jgi:regulator of replication initiation timing
MIESHWRHQVDLLKEELREVYKQVNYYVVENTKLREENERLRTEKETE